MITEAILNFFAGIFQSMMTWLSTHLPSPPSWLADQTSVLSHLTDALSPTVLYFLPIGPAVAMGLGYVGITLALGILRLTRRGVSLFTGGGGGG